MLVASHLIRTFIALKERIGEMNKNGDQFKGHSSVSQCDLRTETGEKERKGKKMKKTEEGKDYKVKNTVTVTQQ